MLTYELEEPELIGGEGLIYLATRVSRKVGGPEEIAEELKDVKRVKRLLTMIVKAGHLSVLEHSLVRMVVRGSWERLASFLFDYKYLEATPLEEGVLISFNPRTAVELVLDPREKIRSIGKRALAKLPLLAEAIGLRVYGEPVLDIRMRKLSEDPLVYSFLEEPHPVPAHGFYAFWSEMSRVTSHQFVRHRRLSFTQRSGRYTRPDGFILPPKLKEEFRAIMEEHFRRSYELYERLLRMGLRREDARYVLPSSLKTALFVSGRQSDWHHFLELRTDVHAQEEIRRIANVIKKVIV